MQLPDSGHGPGGKALGVAGVLGGLAVATGAVGAHMLRDQLTADRLAVWGTAAQYQMYHALALLAVARLLSRRPTALLRAVVGFFVLGIVLFSGSLYALALTGEASLGILTPIGGAALIAGWGCLAASALRPRN